MSKQTKISYIIVTWNNEDIIQECLDSLLQFCGDYENEIIVVDNDSKDRTCEVIKKKYGENILLIETENNNGFSKANNIGLELATGEYVFFINPDVVFIENIVTPMLDILKKEKEIGIVCPRLVYKDLSYQVSTCNFPSVSKLIWDDLHLFSLLPDEKRMKYAQAQYKKNSNRYVDWSYGAAHFCRKIDVDAVGGYPEGYFMYGEDTEFCMQFLNKLEKKTFYLGDIKLIHIGGYSEKQVVNSRKVVYGTRAAMYFVKKYYGKSHMQCYRWLLFFVSYCKYLVYTVKYLLNHQTKNCNGKTKWKASWQTAVNYKGEQN